MRPKIIYLDDDIHPNGRITSRILPVFEDRGLKDIVIHFKTFEEFKTYIQTVNDGSEIGLIILDSSLTMGERMYEIKDTLPYIISQFEEIADRAHKGRLAARESFVSLCQRILPASGRSVDTALEIANQRANNEYFREYMSRRDIPINESQMDIARLGGSTGDPEKVVDAIIKYYSEVHPNENIIEIVKELKKEAKIINEGDTESKTENVIDTEMSILSKEEERPFDALRNKLYDRLGIPQFKDGSEHTRH